MSRSRKPRLYDYQSVTQPERRRRSEALLLSTWTPAWVTLCYNRHRCCSTGSCDRAHAAPRSFGLKGEAPQSAAPGSGCVTDW